MFIKLTNQSSLQFPLQSIQFSDEIFGMDWIKLDKKIKENLIMIMNRSLRPIEFSSAHIITMNLDSFAKVRNKFTFMAVIVFNSII